MSLRRNENLFDWSVKRFTQQNARFWHDAFEVGAAPPRRKPEEQAMFHNLVLPAGHFSVGQLGFVEYLARFDDYCTRADECQRLADRYATDAIKQQYEKLAEQWRELARQVAH
jgi:hypothetical protein